MWKHAHRLSYESFKGEIAQGLFVCHTCDTPCCCNPDHLFAGTPRDNIRDMMAKGRRPHTRLTWDDVAQIRASTSTHAKLAAAFKVSGGMISMIKSGQRW